jgi:hypothetical protein
MATAEENDNCVLWTAELLSVTAVKELHCSFQEQLD